MIKAVLFDYGGVLTKAGTKGSVEKSIAEYHKLKVDDISIEDLIDGIRRGQINTSTFFQKLAEKYPSDNPMTEESFVSRHREMSSQSTEVYALAEKLRQSGIRTGILSNVFEMNAVMLRKIGAYEGFNPVILSCEVKMAKPDLEIYKLAAEKLGVKPEEIIFVDDQEKCWPPAEELGMRVVKAVTPAQIAHDVKSIIREKNSILL